MIPDDIHQTHKNEDVTMEKCEMQRIISHSILA